MNYEDRIERLERTNRRMRLGFVAVALSLMATVLAGQAGPAERQGGDLTVDRLFARGIVVETIVVTNNEGQNRAIISGTAHDSIGVISVTGSDSGPRVWIGGDSSGAGEIKTYTPRGETLVEIRSTSGGDAMIGLSNQQGRSVVEMGADELGSGMLFVNNRLSQMAVSVGVNEDGVGEVLGFGRDELPLTMQTSFDGRRGIFVVYDSLGKLAPKHLVPDSVQDQEQDGNEN